MKKIALHRATEVREDQDSRELRSLLDADSSVAHVAPTDSLKRDSATTNVHVGCSDTASTSLTPTETMLLQMWKRMLWVEDIGPNDSFIDLGGNSLVATRCINRIRSTFDVEVSMDAFFVDPADIATIAHLIDQAKAITEA